ncbi:aspartate racemase [Eubacterium ruminantium]|nr:aspartate racemase [Eubacterium ruminantium]
MEKKKLGILGGMGPEATEILYKKIIEKTAVSGDRDHLDILIYSHATIPDRTECILCGKSEYLWDILKADVEMLRGAGCDYLAVPCNTCHFFAERFNGLMDGGFINMIEETAEYAAGRRYKKVGIMATDGTVQNDMYGKALRTKGIEAVYPDEEGQKKVMSIIYDEIKAGEKGDRHKFMEVAGPLRDEGCEAIILACTELSVFNVNYELGGDYYIDALNVLTRACIEKCGARYMI